jgi:hypothetical protein
MKYLLLLASLLLFINISAQQKVLLDQVEDIERMASQEFEMAMAQPEGSLYLFGQENSIKGVYTFKISIGDKNKVTSVFVLEREGGDIPMQNKVKDAIKEFMFDSFKVPKGKHYNIKYTFQF